MLRGIARCCRGMPLRGGSGYNFFECAVGRPFAARMTTQAASKPLTAPTIMKPAEYKAHIQDFVTFLSERVFPNHIHRVFLRGNELVICTTPDTLIPVLSFLRDHSHAQFKQLSEIAVVDWPEFEHRFVGMFSFCFFRLHVSVCCALSFNSCLCCVRVCS